MEYLDGFLRTYGYWAFFVVGFAEFVGVPILSVPVLIGGGAMVASGTLGPPLLLLKALARGARMGCSTSTGRRPTTACPQQAASRKR